MGDVPPVFGANLKAARKRKGWTQKALAEKIGAGGNTLAQWEQNALTPSDPVQLLDLAELLETTVEELFGKPARSPADRSYRAGVLDAARRLKELVMELELGTTGQVANVDLLKGHPDPEPDGVESPQHPPQKPHGVVRRGGRGKHKRPVHKKPPR